MTNQKIHNPDQNYYSQGGEDFLLRKLFPSKVDGFFVEVGCIDGRCFSNTLHFENMGWNGLCVEAHSDYIHSLRNNRPGSIVEHAAVGECDKDDIDFFANSRGSLSTLDKSKENEFAEGYGEYFTGFQVQKVPMLTLNSIFKKYGIKNIDILSLDIEGYEVQALMGLDLDVYRPKVFVIESDCSEHKRKIESILLPKGYYLIATLDQNLFYSLFKEDQKLIGNKNFKNIPIVHSQHPLDNTNDRHLVVDVSTRTVRPIKLLKTVVKKVLIIFKSFFKSNIDQ